MLALQPSGRIQEMHVWLLGASPQAHCHADNIRPLHASAGFNCPPDGQKAGGYSHAGDWR